MGKKYVVIAALLSIFSGWIIGFHFSVIAGAILFLKPEYSLLPSRIEFIVASLFIGGFFGALLGGFFQDLLGRKKSAIIASIAVVLGNIVSVYIDPLVAFETSRIIVGFGLGAYCAVIPVFVSEISQTKFRGKLVALYQLALVLGATCAYLANIRFDSEALWREMFFAPFYPEVVFLVFLLIIPESPYWYIRKGKIEIAAKLLRKIDSNRDAETVIKESLFHIELEKSVKMFSKPHAKPLSIGFIYALFINIVGPAIVYNYIPQILHSLQLKSKAYILETSTVIGIVSIIASIVAIILVDILGRRLLVLIGLALSTVALVFTAIAVLYPTSYSFLFIFSSMLLFAFGYTVGMGVISFIILAEIYPLKYRGKANGFAHLIAFGGNYLVTRYFLSIAGAIDLFGALFVFAGINAIAFIFTYLFIPETKGLSLEAIENLWIQNSK